VAGGVSVTGATPSPSSLPRKCCHSVEMCPDQRAHSLPLGMAGTPSGCWYQGVCMALLQAMSVHADPPVVYRLLTCWAIPAPGSAGPAHLQHSQQGLARCLEVENVARGRHARDIPKGGDALHRCKHTCSSALGDGWQGSRLCKQSGAAALLSSIKQAVPFMMQVGHHHIMAKFGQYKSKSDN
jgi:hypothetical protein